MRSIRTKIGSSGSDEGAIAEENVNVSIDAQGSEVTREEEIYGETFAQHASHRFIDKETILLHVEEYSGNKYKTDKSIDIDVIEIKMTQRRELEHWKKIWYTLAAIPY